MITNLKLPFPPSVNSLYNGGKNTRRRFTSDKYRAWQDEAYYTLMCQKDKGHRHMGNVMVTYIFSPPDKRIRDVFNYEKAVSDFLVKHQIINDDSDISTGIVSWNIGAPGVEIRIEDL